MNDQFQQALSMCQLMLSQLALQNGGILSVETIRVTVDQISTLPPFIGVDCNKLSEHLEARFTIFTAPHQILGSDDDHVAWLNAKRGSIQQRFWDRYRIYLNGQLPDDAIKSIDRITEDVLARIEDPERQGPWDRRGLVAGDVQSGKTASYCGLICKAADAGYKVIIVLAGIHNSLRSQTQIRLDTGFTGYMSEVRLDNNQQTFIPVGVGHIDSSIRANTGTNRAERGDFSAQVANQFGIQPGGLPLVFVVKKNVSVLRNILAWLKSCADGNDKGTDRRFVRHVPALIVDDEADLASVDTKAQAYDENGVPDPEHNPSRINELIRLIMRSFEKVAYVGYTATPFANIYIHDRGFTPQLGDDLFPRSFIVGLPSPNNYIGPSIVFGIPDDEDVGLEKIEPLPLVRIISDHAASENSDETSGWMPPKTTLKTNHIPLSNGQNRVPPSLRQAIFSFILATTVRRIRKVQPLHNSMLVHVVRYTKVQKLIGDQVEIELHEIVQRLRNGDGSRVPTIYDEFFDIWKTDFLPTNEKMTGMRDDIDILPQWDEVSVILSDVAQSITIRIINGSAGDILTYEEHKETGLNVIAVGGDKLSRGLTLEGLTVTYFLRASRMYDTLMQMGRWFGYRDGYIDACRLYATRELVDWFAHIAAANAELKQVFKHMVDVGGTPRDYGLRVRSHPLLLVTSAVKMRNGTKLHLSFSGDISETIVFNKDPVWISKNFNAINNWLSSQGMPKGGKRKGGYTWKNISVDDILTFLKSYASHENALRANTNLLTKYIEAQQANGELTTWTVHLVSSGDDSAPLERIAEQDIGLIKRSPYPNDERPDRYSIRRLVSPRDEQIDLTEQQKADALTATIENWRNAKEPKRKEQPKSPSGYELRKKRPKENGLLLIYPLDYLHAGIKGIINPVIGIAISFPESKTARPVSYIVNNRYLQGAGDDESL
jgi:hypothetical protein